MPTKKKSASRTKKSKKKVTKVKGKPPVYPSYHQSLKEWQSEWKKYEESCKG